MSEAECMVDVMNACVLIDILNCHKIHCVNLCSDNHWHINQFKLIMWEQETGAFQNLGVYTVNRGDTTARRYNGFISNQVTSIHIGDLWFLFSRDPDREYSDQYSQLSKRQWDQSAGLAYLTVNLGGSMQDTLIECVVDSLSEWDLQPRPWDYNREPVLNLNLWTGHGCLNMQSGHIGGFKTGLTEVGSFRISLSGSLLLCSSTVECFISHRDSICPALFLEANPYLYK